MSSGHHASGVPDGSDAGREALEGGIADLCDRFRSAWRLGERPAVEQYVAQVPARFRDLALHTLLMLELELSMSTGVVPDRDEWHRRFPTNLALVDSVLDRVYDTREAALDVAREVLAERGESDQSDSRRRREAGDPSPAASDETQVQSVTTATRYRNLRPFRRGGMSELFLAFDEDLGRDTVVKRLRKQFAHQQEYADQLEVEAEITGRLDHPGIVPVYGIGEDWEGKPFYVMRVIRGRELQTAITEFHHAGGFGKRSGENRRQLYDLLEHFVSACNTVAFAHDAGVIHCDLKPANIMIGRYGETFVVDWGLARPFERTTEFRKASEKTVLPHDRSSGSVRGYTPGYVSPEQYSGTEAIGAASDIYSLGATLYQILTNQTPLAGTEVDFAERLTAGRLVAPRKIFTRIPRTLEAVCLKALHTDPYRRHVTAKQLAADLQNWMHDEEVDSAPDSWSDRIFRWCRRHRALAAASLLTLMVVVAAGALIGTSLRYARLADRSRQRAEKRFEAALDTFEQLTVPLANEEKNQLGAFNPLAENIAQFTAAHLDDPEFVEQQNLSLGRIWELQATARSVSRPDRETWLHDLRQAETIYVGLLAEDASHEMARWRLACNRLMQGRVLARYSENQQALPVLEQALSDFHTLRDTVAQDGRRVLLVRREAEAHHALGEVYLGLANTTGDEQGYRKSEDHFLESRRLRRDLHEEALGEDRFARELIQRDLARSHGYLGDLYLRRGLVAAAEREYDDSLALRTALYQSNRVDPEHRFQYARGLANFGTIENVQRRNLRQALDRLAKAREVQLSLTEDFPGNADFILDLMWSLNSLAELHLVLGGDTEEADTRAAHLQQAEEYVREAQRILVRIPADDPRALRGMALSNVLRAELHQPSDPEQAARFARDAVRQMEQVKTVSNWDQDDYFCLSIALAVLGRDSDALENLALAVEKGANTVARFQAHRQLAWQSLSKNPDTAARLESWIDRSAERLAP